MGVKKMTALFLAVLLALGTVACGADDEEETGSGGVPSEKFDFSAAGATQGLTMSVNRDSGQLNVKRLSLPGKKNTGDAGKWTVFIYLCGTDLESEDASATDDLLEMVDGTSGENMRFVVETGGAEEWLNNTVEAGKLQRYLVQDGNLELVDEQPSAGMGHQETLADFLQWGVTNYASEHMGVILWNHGGGSITGVCFDETDDNDSLSLREMDAALLHACAGMGRKFDFIGFDACLMGTLETANILASYADYMIGSQETVPGTGWDYTAIGRYLSANPGVDAKQLGIVICDSFLEVCRAIDDDDLCTLSLIDLSKLDALLVAFNDFAHGMYDAAADAANCTEMIRAIAQTDNFGGNNRSEGYTNMVDMGGIISACASYSEGAQGALSALQDAVAYSVSGQVHGSASGLSAYYPLSVQGSEELAIFGDICPSPYYLSFVDRQNQGSVNAGETDDYDDDFWFGDSGDWLWGSEENSDYWDYLDDFSQTGESALITFAVEPHLDEDGDFWFELDDDGWMNALDVYGMVYQMSGDGEDIIELGETYDLQGGWDSGIFMDDFDGWWISLPDGQNLATYIVESTEDYTIYTSPILLNGEETNLRLKLDYAAGDMFIEGAWAGVDESGAASRSLQKIVEGDVIVPLYNAFSLEGDDTFYYYGREYTVEGTPEIWYNIMDDGDYFFSFCIEDIYGDYYISDMTMFSVEDGEVYYNMD